MHLKSITLNNFRCFEHLEIELHPRLTVFVADNGGGKTAILDALAIGLSPVLRHLSSANQRLAGIGIRDTDFRLESWEGRGGKERWGASNYAQIILETTNGLHWDNWRPSIAGKEPPHKVGESLLADYLARISDSFKTATPALMPVFAYFGASRGHIEIPERLRSTRENYAHPTSALVGALNSLSDFKEMLKWFDIEEASELRANKGAGEDYSPSASLEAVRAALSALLGGVYHNPHFNRERKFVVEPVEGGAPLQVSQLSQGYQSMLALGMDFARRLALGNPHMDNGQSATIQAATQELMAFDFPEDATLPTSAPMIAPAIMLVDEIDLHLHPSWQQRVLGDLMAAFPNTQFIVTTHSPQVLTTARKESIRVIEWENGQAFASMPTHETYAQESRTTLEDVLRTLSRPPLDINRKLADYLRQVEDGNEESSAARQLRTELERALGAGDSQLQLADMLIARNQAARRKG
ncbi:MAG TPA: AAA family ATPase [Candidatus Accumulibacter phosphatis]|nr:AAA family ATPase [Candidatus Accumulibacter phosphatis]